MNRLLLNFISTLLFTSLIFIFGPGIAKAQGWIESVPSFSVGIVTTLALLTLTLFVYLQKIQKSNPQKFIQSYMLTITVKMVVGCGLILALIFMDRENAMANALLFILSYFSLTAIEIFFLWRGRIVS